MVLYLDRMCQRGLHAVLWSFIGTLMHRLAAEPCSTAGLLFPSRCPSGTIFLTPYSMVWDWRVLRARPMLLYWPKQLYPYYGLFPFLFFLSIGRYCVAGVFGLIGCISLSLSLALPTFFNNNNNNKAVDLVCLVFQDAYDKVPHERLMAKVNVNGIQGDAARWLVGRRHRVCISRSYSNWA